MYSGVRISTEAILFFSVSIFTKTNLTSVHFRLSPESYFIKSVSAAGILFQTCKLYDVPLVTIYVSINSLVILGTPLALGGTISNCPRIANSGNDCSSNVEAINFGMLEPSVLVFPVRIKGCPINLEKYFTSVSG